MGGIDALKCLESALESIKQNDLNWIEWLGGNSYGGVNDKIIES